MSAQSLVRMIEDCVKVGLRNHLVMQDANLNQRPQLRLWGESREGDLSVANLPTGIHTGPGSNLPHAQSESRAFKMKSMSPSCSFRLSSRILFCRSGTQILYFLSL